MKTLEEIGDLIGFKTKAKNYRKAFYDKYILPNKIYDNYQLLIEHFDLIHIFDLEDKIHWNSLSSEKMSFEFIDSFKDYIKFYSINYKLYDEKFAIRYLTDLSECEIIKHIHLSENFINKLVSNHTSYYFWNYISEYQILSEDFIQKHKDFVKWDRICQHQYLTEDFIDEFEDYMKWDVISMNQKLSESFIEKKQHNVYWSYIIEYQSLSEKFINKFKDNFDWYYVQTKQKMSLNFINRNNHKCDKELIEKYQYFDKEFEHDLKDLSLYEVKDGYVYGYKSVRKDRFSLYNFQYQYLDGSIHESFSDQTSYENSFGLSIGTKEFAIQYGDSSGLYTLLYIRTKISDITRIVHNGQKLRSRKIEILHEV